MGLITGLFTLPLAPVRGVRAVAGAVGKEAERQQNDPATIRSELERVEQQWQDGTISAEQRTAVEDELVARLVTRRELDGGRG